MELIHTSPAEITKINRFGRFGEFLFFSATEYSMSVGGYDAYSIELDDSEVIEAGKLFYHENYEILSPLVARVVEMFDCSEDDAQDLISQNATAFDFGGDGEQDWDLQRITADAAKLLGFRGVSMSDEQGACYMIDMLGRESDLVHIGRRG